MLHRRRAFSNAPANLEIRVLRRRWGWHGSAQADLELADFSVSAVDARMAGVNCQARFKKQNLNLVSLRRGVWGAEVHRSLCHFTRAHESHTLFSELHSCSGVCRHTWMQPHQDLPRRQAQTRANCDPSTGSTCQSVRARPPLSLSRRGPVLTVH